MRVVLLGTASLAMLVLAVPVMAQEVDAGRESEMGGDIIVTANRREQRVLDIPMSIQVASGEQLANQGINELTDLQFTTPGFLTQTNSGFTQIFMRGVGNSIYVGADPSVATFVDDVPRIYGSMTDNLPDLERLEVLKGAQGGLYGRNATGGVVNIITQSPDTDAVAGHVTATYGERNTFRIGGFINLPISEKVALSLSGQRSSHGAYVKNRAVATPYSAANFPEGAFLAVPNGTPAIPVSPDLNAYAYTPEQTATFFNSSVQTPALNDEDFWSGRGKLLLQPTENLKIVLAADYWRKNDNNGSGQVNISPALTQDALENPEYGFFSLFGINAQLPDGFLQGPQRKFESYAGFASILRYREYGFSGTVTWSTANFDITSITAHRNQKTLLFSDANSAAVPLALLDVRFRKKFTYQEFRAVSNFDGPWRMIAGATYLNNRQFGGQQVYLLAKVPQFQVGDTVVDDKITNWSVYGELGYDFADKLNLTVSGRYIREKNTADFIRPTVSSAQTVQQKFVPSVTLQYDLDRGNVYARWARGFKTGGINLAVASAYFPRPQDGSVFGPETVDTFEVGYKQSLFNNRLQFSTAVFYNDYRDLQVDSRNRPEYPQIVTAVINAKSARTWGIEGSAAWRVAEPLTLTATAGYLDAKYRDFQLVGSQVLADFDQSGLRMPKAPKWQASFNADLDAPLNDRLRLVSNVLVSHTSEVVFQRPPTPNLGDAIGPAYWIVNARLGVKTTDDKFGLALVADNLFNAAYYTFGQSSGAARALGWGNPRIVRAEATMQF